MVDLCAHEAGNGGQGQGRPTAQAVLFYSEVDLAAPADAMQSCLPPMKYWRNVILCNSKSPFLASKMFLGTNNVTR